jgi:hypothetical protein
MINQFAIIRYTPICYTRTKIQNARWTMLLSYVISILPNAEGKHLSPLSILKCQVDSVWGNNN